MKISTKGRYGLRAMLDLALNSDQSHVALKNIADRQKISECYLEQLFSSLRRAGLVNSIRGSQGGYRLSREPDEISIGEILRALEGSLAPVECVTENEEGECAKADICVSRVIWEKIRDSVNEVVNSIKLSDLVQDYNEKSKKFDMLLEKGGQCSG